MLTIQWTTKTPLTKGEHIQSTFLRVHDNSGLVFMGLTQEQAEILYIRQNIIAGHHRVSGSDLSTSSLIPDTFSTGYIKLKWLLCFPWDRLEGCFSDGPAQASTAGQFHALGHRAEEAYLLLYPATRHLLLVSSCFCVIRAVASRHSGEAVRWLFLVSLGECECQMSWNAGTTRLN